MFTNNFDPVAFHIFSLEIRWYSFSGIPGPSSSTLINRLLFFLLSSTLTFFPYLIALSIRLFIHLLIEFFRVPDEQLGYLVMNLTMGQTISLIFLVIGIYLISKNHEIKKRN